MYEQSTSVVVDALTNSSAVVFDDATIQRILSLTTQGTTDTTVSVDQVTSTGGLVTAAAGTEVVFIGSSSTSMTSITAPKNVPVVVFQGQGGVNAVFNDGQTTVQSGAGVVDRVIVNSIGADNIVIADGKNSQITIGAGDTVVAGAGNDTVIAGLGNSTVIGGTGHTIVEMAGDESDYVVTVVNGHAVVKNSVTGITTDISKAQFVQLDNGDALVFANNSLEASVSTLYETAFGRAADAQGLKFWFDRAHDGVSLSAIADAFAAAAEFGTQAARDDSAFVASLYQNTFGRAADASGLAYWTNALANNSIERGDLLEHFADIAGQNLAGTLTTETSIIGTVTIIPGIIG